MTPLNVVSIINLSRPEQMMSIDFILPDIGEGIVECELVEWLVNEGDVIVEDQPIADVMTDKALVQIPAMHNGVIEKLYYQQGEIAKVHQPLFSIIPQGASADAHKAAPQPVEPVAIAAANAVEDFILPDIGEGIVECELVEWLVNEGDIIEEDQAIADVMTDKALVQIPAMYAGKVVKLYYAKGDIAKVHQPLFAIEIFGNVAASLTAVALAEPALKKAAEQAIVQSAGVALTTLVANGKTVASPAVRRVAREMNINIDEVSGTGNKGRVYKEDVVAFSKDSTNNRSEQAVVAKCAGSIGGTRVEPIRGMKAVMAKAMVKSVSTIPHFTYCEEIDMTNLIKFRKDLKETSLIKALTTEQNIKLTMMPFFMKAMSLALKQFPVINSQINEACSELTYFDDHNIGMAVDSTIGLLVPNVKQVQTKSIVDLATDITRLTEEARSGRVPSADLTGGTITISNIGAIGGTVATPIINKPEAAIVALGKLQTLPRFNAAGKVEARSIMQVSWSGDHRIIDGASIARFCNLWKSFLEDPANMLIHLT